MERAVTCCAAWDAAFEALFAKLVVNAALLVIRKHIVRLGDLLELLLRSIAVVGVLVCGKV